MQKPDFLLGQLRRQQESMLAQFNTLPGEVLRVRPAANDWSPLEVLSHLTRVDEAVAASMRFKLGKPLQATRSVEVLRGLGLCVYMLAPTRVKMPQSAVAAIAPEPDGELAALTVRWQAARASFAEFDFPHISESAVVFRNPVAGWLTTTGTLRFLLAHTFHHRHQLRRIDRSSQIQVTKQ